MKEEYFPYVSYIDIKNLATNINDSIFMTIKAIFITVTEVYWWASSHSCFNAGILTS